MTNKINQHYQTCSDMECPIFNLDKQCESLNTGQCQYQTMQILQNAPETNQELNGKKHGVFRYWHDNGKLWIECNFKDGEKHGLYRYWCYDGQLSSESNYIDGKRVKWIA